MIENMQPGKYRTRDGSVVSLSHSDDTLSHGYYWVGSVAGKADLWDRQGGYWSTGDESPFDLVARIPDEPPVDDRIERALQVLRNASRQDGPYGTFVAAEEVNEAIQILESTP